METIAVRPSDANSPHGDESVGLAARALAHDFNNLLAAILGHASYLRLITEPGSEVDQAAATIEMAAARAKGLAAQLHQLGNQVAQHVAPHSQLQFAPVDLHAVVHEVAATLQTGQSRAVRFTLSLAAASPVVTGDAGQLNQLVMNLAVNACEAMVVTGGHIEIATASDDRGVQLEVRDSGPGIPVEMRAKAFEVSYSTKSAGGGLGLAIVRRIAKDHGATAEILDNQPRGTIFRLRFPQA